MQSVKKKADGKSTEDTHSVNKYPESEEHMHEGKQKQTVNSKETAESVRAEGVREALLHFWRGYREKAWGRDEVRPISGEPGGSWGNVGMTILDSLDTLWLAGLRNEFSEGEAWVSTLSFDRPNPDRVSFFETTIRAFAGLLSSYALSKRPVFLEKARDLGDRLLQGFSGVWAAAYISLADPADQEATPSWRRWSCALSDVGSNVLEFAYLSQATGDAKYKTAAEANMRKIMSLALRTKHDLAPMFLRQDSVEFSTSGVSMGAFADSYFEYLLKMYLLSGRRDRAYLEAWKAAMREMREALLRVSPEGLTYVATKSEHDQQGWQATSEMDHLACFVGGNLALGSFYIPKQDREDWWLPTAKEITRTCFETYRRSPSGLAAEVNLFSKTMEPIDGQYRLRPETLESLFYLYRVTGDQTYRDWSWQIFTAINKTARAPWGFAKVTSTHSVPVSLEDSQETFMGAETLKYALLVHLPPEVLPLDSFVLNTEAHPLPTHSKL